MATITISTVDNNYQNQQEDAKSLERELKVLSTDALDRNEKGVGLWWWQFRILLHRNLVYYSRNPASLARILIYLAIGVLQVHMMMMMMMMIMMMMTMVVPVGRHTRDITVVVVFLS